MTNASLLEHADAAVNSYAVAIVGVLVAMVFILAVWLLRERSAARALRNRVSALESRVDALDALLVGLVTTLMTSQSHSDVGGHAAKNASNYSQELEHELQAMRNKEGASAGLGASADEFKISNLLRRLATL
jgi:cell division protein ZapA (FtsZ GTPase activity inhibitor)